MTLSNAYFIPNAIGLMWKLLVSSLALAVAVNSYTVTCSICLPSTFAIRCNDAHGHLRTTLACEVPELGRATVMAELLGDDRCQGCAVLHIDHSLDGISFHRQC